MRDTRGDRRGRRPNRPDPAAGPVEAFADQLWQLKIAAGDPTFAEMCDQLGAAASKSSLAAASQGRTLPSWAVTWEFVRVLAVGRLGQDPAEAEREWLARWRKAFADLGPPSPNTNTSISTVSPSAVGTASPSDVGTASPSTVGTGSPLLVGTASSSDVGTASLSAVGTGSPSDVGTASPSLVGTGSPSLEEGAPGEVAPRSAEITVFAGGASRSREARVAGSARRFGPRVLAAAAVALVVAVAGAFLVNGRSPEKALVTPIPLDESIFEGDITIPDGTLIAKGESFEKVWRIKNTGKVEWSGRFLMRVNDTVCSAPRKVEIPHTPPGDSVDIRVPVVAPDIAGACKIFWKMVDDEGRLLFPDKRPIFLDVRVG
ncbi:NBR1-Ig-like domain-containing protein [Herbidospora mongoliensis]|uniref:NBR1-Ig-like domain-containing protein n=1 Tax=Herbidospora mongoliensis TaxID=688067 RepID=UPI000A51DB13|nr:NBR1-Ig-like domain-containing protein [Herbidospora mongoliensis]